MKIIIPMAGQGLRFKDQGYSEIKPLIPIRAKPMVQWTVESVKRAVRVNNSDFIFVILKRHNTKYGVKKNLQAIFPGSHYLIIDEPTKGAAATALLAKSLVGRDEELIITDSDQCYIVSKFSHVRQISLNKNYAGVIATYLSSNTTYSYVKKDKNGFVTETREKKAISNEAAIGMYYFTRSKYFMQSIKEIMKKKELSQNEYYVCPVYNHVIRFGKVVTVKADFWMTMGSPGEAKRFSKLLQRPSKFLKQLQN